MAKDNSTSNKQNHHIGLIIFLILLIISLSALALNVRKFSSKQVDPVVENSKRVSQSSSISSTRDQVVGSYRDDKDGAAIVLSDNGTGRYVYADKNNPDTNDSLTWKKQGSSYLITLQDKDVVNPLNAKLNGQQLTITGNGGWNTENFNRVSGSLNLDDFLQQAHGQR